MNQRTSKENHQNIQTNYATTNFEVYPTLVLPTTIIDSSYSEETMPDIYGSKPQFYKTQTSQTKTITTTNTTNITYYNYPYNFNSNGQYEQYLDNFSKYSSNTYNPGLSLGNLPGRKTLPANMYQQIKEKNNKNENNPFCEIKKNINNKTNIEYQERKTNTIQSNTLNLNNIYNMNNYNDYNNYNRINSNSINNIKNINNNNNEYDDIIDIYNKIYNSNIIYKIDENKDKIRIFGKYFVENNKNKIKIEIEGKEYELMEYYKINNKNKYLHIKIKEIENVTDMSYMFSGCSSLSNIKALQNWNVSNGNNFSFIFSECSSLLDIKELENWNVSNGHDFSYMFYQCSSLSDIKGLENWNVSNGNDFG